MPRPRAVTRGQSAACAAALASIGWMAANDIIASRARSGRHARAPGEHGHAVSGHRRYPRAGAMMAIELIVPGTAP